MDEDNDIRIRRRSLMFANSQIGVHRSLANRHMLEILATAYEAGAQDQMYQLSQPDGPEYVHKQWDPQTRKFLPSEEE